MPRSRLPGAGARPACSRRKARIFRGAQGSMQPPPPDCSARLDPLRRGDGFQLCRLIRKMEPDLEDPRIRERVDRQIVVRHFLELTAEHIRWIMPPPTYDAAAR